MGNSIKKLSNDINELPTYNHPWYEKRIAIIGDSISDPAHIGTTKCYYEYMQDLLHMTYQSYAQNGAQSNLIISQAQQIKAYEDNNNVKFDAIFVFMGTNDYMSNIQLGEWFTYTDDSYYDHGYSPQLRTFTDSGTTFKSRLNIGLGYLTTNFPDCQIILLTPIHRSKFDTSQPDENYSNRLKLYINDYVNVVKEASSIWSTELIDLFSVSRLFPHDDSYVKFFAGDTRPDRLHPNALGHLRIAKTIIAKLNSIAVLS